MLLMCCFRESKSNKKSRLDEESYTRTIESENRAPKRRSSKIFQEGLPSEFSAKFSKKEKHHFNNKEHKKSLLKQRSQDSLSNSLTIVPQKESSSSPSSQRGLSTPNLTDLPSHYESEKVQERQMCRSNGSYAIQALLQNQIQEENTKKFENQIQKIKEAHELQIEELRSKHRTQITNYKNEYETKSKQSIFHFENIISKLKDDHLLTIKNLTIDFERQKIANNEEYNKKILEYQERDSMWQNEKQDVLSEIQRLKCEANRFLAILSAEEDDDENDSLSSTRKQNLGKEIESLQLVVEMKNNEIHKLREEQMRHLEQLEELESTRNQLGKMKAKAEDLAAQLENKNKIEKKLSLENTKLENSFEVEAKKKARISMQIEELQWRIRHNYDLPPPKMMSPEKEAFFYNSNHSNNNNNNNSENVSISNSAFESSSSSLRPVVLRFDSVDRSHSPSLRDDSLEGSENDEGLGDISSESSSSPPPKNIVSSNSLDERVPSRIPFSLETNL